MKIELKKILHKFYKNKNSQEEIKLNVVCYGLGSVDESFSSRFQLALLLLMIDEINSFEILDEINFTKNKATQFYKINLVELFDPVFNEYDEILLRDVLNFKLEKSNVKCIKSIRSETSLEIDESIYENLESKFESNLKLNSEISKTNNSQKVLTLFYMPHCGKALYNNLLYANWKKECLKSFILLGNSFETINTINLDDKMKKSYSFIKDSLLLIDEIRCNSECEFTNSFNDFCFTIFNVKKLEDSTIIDNLINELNNDQISSTLREPSYDSDEEISV